MWLLGWWLRLLPAPASPRYGQPDLSGGGKFQACLLSMYIHAPAYFVFFLLGSPPLLEGHVLCFEFSKVGGTTMTTAQRFRLGLFFAAMPVLGAAYGVFEQQRAIDSLTHSIKEVMPWLIYSMKEVVLLSLPLILALVVYGLFHAAGSVLERLNGVSLAAHATLHVNYGKASPTPTV